MRLLLLMVYAVGISLLGVAAIKVAVVYLARLLYGGAHEWSRQDANDIFVHGFVLGGVMCAFIVAARCNMGRRS